MDLNQFNREVIHCERCPRLVAYCRRVAAEKKRAFQEEAYWGKPVPGFGDPKARLVLVGLAPAAHGANRTGRMFTGDGTDGAGASDFLMRALHRAGLANQPHSRHRGDGLRFTDAYVTAIVRCAPPANKPLPEEIANCGTHLMTELDALKRMRVIVALGKLAHDQLLRLYEARGVAIPRPRPKFAHGSVTEFGDSAPVIVGSYHPSRQNTQTGKLTPAMFDAIFTEARKHF